MRFSGVLIVVVLGVVTSACDGLGLNPSTATAPGGNVVGNQFNTADPATPERAAIDAMIGGELGDKLDEADRKAVYEAQHRALEFNRSGTPVAWNNPASGNNGEVVPGPAYTINNSQCRDYSHTIYIDGQPQVSRGTACRKRDGGWDAIS